MPTPYRYTTPVSRKSATGIVAAVYQQIAADFILANGPLMSLSPTPDLLAATWSLLREAQLAGRAPRVTKEAVGTAVSMANRCQFCVDAHTALLHAAGEHALAEALWRGNDPADPELAALVAWAAATARHDAIDRVAAPFPPELTGEYVGAVLVTHFINRMVSSLLNENLLPGRIGDLALVRRIAGGALSRAVRRQPRDGESLPLLGEVTAPVPVWAGDSPIATAYAALRTAAATGEAQLGSAAKDIVLSTIAGWDGVRAQFAEGGLEAALARIPSGDWPGARLALLAAIAPHHISDADVAAWRAIEASDAALIRLVAFGAMAAVERIEAWTVAAIPTVRRSIDAAA